MEISFHRRFQVLREPRERATHASQSEFWLVLSHSKQRRPRICGHRAQNLLVLRSPQLSFTFGPYVRAGMDLFGRHAGFSHASKASALLSESQSKLWSGGRLVCQTCFATTVVRYTDPTGVVVSTDVGCCSWPFYR